MSGGRNTHWCHRCRQPVCLRARDAVICPICNGGFVQTLDEVSRGRPVDFFGLDDHDDFHGRRFGTIDALSSFMRRQLEEMHDHGGRFRRSVPDHSLSRGGVPWLVFGGQFPLRRSDQRELQLLFSGGPGIGVTRGGTRDYFMGPGLEELIEQLSISGVGSSQRRGPPAASRSSINAMPTVKIKKSHLRSDSQCPVCMERFELGSEAKQMPCKHLYHSACITPWLAQHNSCPVCRYEMPTQGSSSGRSQGRRNPFSFLWRSGSSNSRRSAAAPSTSSSTSHEDNLDHHPAPAGYSGWPFN
uniref:RING-type E3 ubiquitin transferase n=1 Tax=Kalanchoe fedtschenkoi TaxID=63787 RepID=A0A7N0V136_KALFE